MLKISTIILILLSFFISSCGFQFQGSGSILPAEIKNIYIEDSVNNSTNSIVGISLTEALKDRFDRYATLSVVDSENESDAILKSEIVSLAEQSKSVTASSDIALELDTILIISAELIATSGRKLWSSEKMRFISSYGASSSAVVTSSASFTGGNLNSGDLAALNERELARGQEDLVIEDLVEDAAKKIYNDAVLPEF